MTTPFSKLLRPNLGDPTLRSCFCYTPPATYYTYYQILLALPWKYIQNPTTSATLTFTTPPEDSTAFALIPSLSPKQSEWPLNTEVRSPSPCSDSSEALEALELLQSCALDLKSLTWSAFPPPLLYFWTHVLLLFPMLTPISACLEHPGPCPPLVLFQILTQCHPLCTAFSDQTPYNCKTTPIMTFQPACLTSSFLLAPTAYTHCIFYLLTHYLSSPYNILHEGRYFSSFLFAALPSLSRKMSGIE